MYHVEPQTAGVYPVSIQVVNSCLGSDTYAFDVIFTNSDPIFANCRDNCLEQLFILPLGYGFSYPLQVTDPDGCDGLNFYISDVVILWGGPFNGDVYVDSNVVIVEPTEMDGGTAICVAITVEDTEGGYSTCELGYDLCCYMCGNVDHLGVVDIDDAVFLMTYVFASGFPPEPYQMGDVDCSGGVDIDDVVYIVAYIFAGGSAPCDTDGDGIPDC